MSSGQAPAGERVLLLMIFGWISISMFLAKKFSFTKKPYKQFAIYKIELNLFNSIISFLNVSFKLGSQINAVRLFRQMFSLWLSTYL